MGLHLTLERGMSGVQVRAVHQRLAGEVGRWPHLEPPADRGQVRTRRATTWPADVPIDVDEQRLRRASRPSYPAAGPTVFDVAMAGSASAHVEQLRRWAESVWQAWAQHHAEVAAWVERYRAAP